MTPATPSAAPPTPGSGTAGPPAQHLFERAVERLSVSRRGRSVFFLEAENYTAAPRTGRLSWQLTDWMNRETASGHACPRLDNRRRSDPPSSGGNHASVPSSRPDVSDVFRWSGAQGERAENTQYFGVIDSRPRPVGTTRTGTHRTGPSGAVDSLFQRFRIGLVRVGSASGFRHPSIRDFSPVGTPGSLVRRLDLRRAGQQTGGAGGVPEQSGRP